MLIWILLGIVVYLANVFLPTILFLPAEGLIKHIGSRDNMPEPSVLVSRARRALANFQENLPIFLALGLMVLIVNPENMAQAILGAQIFVVSRIAYIILYMISIPMTRTMAYGAGFVGMVLMALSMF